MSTHDRLFGYQHAFDHHVTVIIVSSFALALALSLPTILLLSKLGKIDDKLRKELVARCVSWMIMAPVMLVPILLGAAWTIVVITFASLLCYREFARATGLFRHRLASFIVVLGILGIHFAALDHWYGFFVALPSLTIAILAASQIIQDQPKGYIQRVALAVVGFLLFGVCMGHLSFYANDVNYRPMLIMILAGAQLNDVFAFCSGKLFGRRKLAPNTSPNKTIEGFIGAFILTTTLVAIMAHYVYMDTPLDQPVRLICLGMIVSVGGAMGDLMLSSIKRDLGIKDMGSFIPGHGGALDRCNSLLLVVPATFHYIGFYVGIGLDGATRIITGEG